MNSATHGGRQALRDTLLAARSTFVASTSFAAAEAALGQHLAAVLAQLEPELLGLYWPHRFEFDAVAALRKVAAVAALEVCLPYAQRAPVRMHYRAWDRSMPTAVDECGIPSSLGAPVTPDVVLVPCVGYTGTNHRLGYGGGFFDRWLAQHPGVTAVGVAWRVGLIEDAGFEAAAHDQPLTLIVTEEGVA